jgi:4-nitrophenyl phosphatase/NagD protein
VLAPEIWFDIPRFSSYDGGCFEQICCVQQYQKAIGAGIFTMMDAAQKLNQAKCILFDMDGTISLGDRLLPGAQDLTRFLEKIQLPFYFLTNNSSKSRDDYAEKLLLLGLPADRELIISSGQATALYLRKRKPGARLYVVGTPSLEEEFSQYGFRLVEEDPDYAVLGFDTTLTYEKLRKLCDFVREGRPYIATHPDINCPTEDGFIPDIGSIIALVAASTGLQPDVVIGKPHNPIVETIMEITGFSRGEIVMVGDRLYTDIALGRAGLTTVLVLTEETKLADIPGSPYQPDVVVENLEALLRIFKGDLRNKDVI